MSAPDYLASTNSTVVNNGKPSNGEEDLHRYVTDDIPRTRKTNVNGLDDRGNPLIVGTIFSLSGLPLIYEEYG
ncbi:hypothetical protein M231_06057 [Tremella mesenterica]|uniref:Uncharacterized protein n=1 Tax=Tremella mesenterica TaxID=5217 RepID=A0A4V1M3F3_TREME|nr:hypothetical protein M231_06057 [Tremella mesenterica]